MNSFILFIKVFLYSLYKISPKSEFTHLKKVKYIAKLRKIKAKSKSFVKNIYFQFEDKSIKDLWVSKNNILYYINFN